MIDFEFIKNQEKEYSNKSNEIRINCPECGDNNFHMYCNLIKRVYICHRCGAKGRIQKQIGIEDFTRIRDSILKTKSSKQILLNHIIDKVKNLPRNFPMLDMFDLVPGHKAKIYLNNRGITRQDCIDYDIRFSVDKSGPYQDTIIFPVWHPEYEDLRYFVCRRYTNQKPKYINAPWPKQDTLYSCGPRQTDSVIIVEGIIDAISIAKCGYTSIALLGKVATSQQLVRLSQIKKRVFIYLDHDAFSQALDLKLKFAAMDKIATIIYDYKDANELLVNGSLVRFLNEQTKHLQ